MEKEEAEKFLKQRTHDLKIYNKYFCAVKSGTKTFEIRLNDRDYQVGDILILREFDGEKYTGRKVKREVTYVFKGGTVGLLPSFCVMSIKEVEEQK